MMESASEMDTSEAEAEYLSDEEDAEVSRSYDGSEEEEEEDSDALVEVGHDEQEVEIEDDDDDDDDDGDGEELRLDGEVDGGDGDALHSESEDGVRDSELSSMDEEEVDHAYQERYVMDAIDKEGNNSDDGEEGYEEAVEKAKRVLGSQGGPARVRGAGTEELSDGERDRLQGIYTGRGRKFNKRRKLGRPKHYKERNVSDAALQMQGEANMLYATGDYAKAADVLVEVVRIAPSLTDSYHTLGLVHEALGNAEKAMEFLMIAAHVQARDYPLWLTVADRCETLGNHVRAAYCLTKCIRYSPDEDINPELLFRRADAYANMGEKKKAMRDIKTLNEVLPPRPELNVLVELSALYDKIGNREMAVSILLDAVPQGSRSGSCPPELALSITNMYIKQGNYEEALTYAEDCLARDHASKSKPVVLQLHANAGIAALKLGDKAGSEKHFGALEEESGPDVAEAFVKVADSFYLSNDPRASLTFYKKLEGIKAFDQPALYSKMAECQQAIGEFEEAAVNFRKVMSRVPADTLDHLLVSLMLCDLLHKNGKEEDVVEVLEDLEKATPLKMEGNIVPMQKKLFEQYTKEGRYNLRYNRKERYVEIMSPLLLFLWDTAVTHQQHQQERRQQRENAKKGGDGAKVPRTRTSIKNAVLTEAQLFPSTIECCKQLVHVGDLEELEKLLNAAEPFFQKKSKGISKDRKTALRFLRCIVNLRGGRGKDAFDDIREVCAHAPASNVLWNVFFHIAQVAGVPLAQMPKLKHKSDKNNLQAMMANAHHSSLTDNLEDALRDYWNVLLVDNWNPVVLLCLAVHYLQKAVETEGASVETEYEKNYSILNAFYFLGGYAHREGYSPGAVYNTARAFHQIGLLHFAQELYNKVLKKIGEAKGGKTSGEDLSAIETSAAHNLVAIYEKTGAKELAQDIAKEHLENML
ncbi:TPR repeat domain-containing protein [Chloropicon primus]|uniref:Uncharacterized protein n=2 Tax=Chloropicon primus TaxID=1764295 RepID=A0A5B8MPR1_9CHLO|nr:hypothetical protein A3770_07p49350 [Chloropicon primus]UPR01635.1 TPR repeat domain-containing protein [Chloropicon primus]|eukprot:QDZ22417.1 hypothetical protein A3770_07p49350 [Chloropicon primus]